MSLGEITLVCEGEPEGRDIRWLGLALDKLGVAKAVEISPSGSKANLVPTVRALRARGQARVYAIRDRDFLHATLLEKNLGDGLFPLQRHCLETYLLEPELLEAAVGAREMKSKIEQLAEERFWLDVGRAVLEDFAFSLRTRRPTFDDEDGMPVDRSETERKLKSKLEEFSGHLKIPDVAAGVDRFQHDMQDDPKWTRVDGKSLFKAVEKELAPGGDLERKLFVWCSEKGAPDALVRDVRLALEKLGAWSAASKLA